MTRLYQYVGPENIRAEIGPGRGTAIRSVADLVSWVDGQAEATPIATYVVDDSGVLRLAPRRSEHVACAGGGSVYAAGEMRIEDHTVVELSNQSTGYCPDPSCESAIVSALDAAGIEHPGGFTARFVFRRCESCGQRAIVKDDWFVCDLCGAELPAAWNFGVT